MSRADDLQRYVTAFEQLTPDSLRELQALFTPDARFIDPFNDVCGTQAIEKVFAHMFAELREPRFVVSEAALTGDVGLLVWTLDFLDAGGAARRIVGASRVQFAADGRVCRHEDFWDPAAQIYEDVPLLGGLMRWLRRRLSAS
jgi:steroid delta-isomerase